MQNINALRDELISLGTNTEIPSEIKRFIEKEVSPEYILRDRVEHYKTYLTVIATITALGSALIPYPFSRVFTVVMLSASAVLALLLVRSMMNLKRPNLKPILIRAAPWMAFVFSAFSGVIAMICIAVSLTDNYIGWWGAIPTAIFTLISAGFGILSVYLLNRLRRNAVVASTNLQPNATVMSGHN
jgi:hypothetical protein